MLTVSIKRKNKKFFICLFHHPFGEECVIERKNIRERDIKHAKLTKKVD